MNIDVEITFKFKATDKPTTEPCKATLVRILDKLASHPCILLILRELAKR
jgi:hypothetical protein